MPFRDGQDPRAQKLRELIAEQDEVERGRRRARREFDRIDGELRNLGPSPGFFSSRQAKSSHASSRHELEQALAAAHQLELELEAKLRSIAEAKTELSELDQRSRERLLAQDSGIGQRAREISNDIQAGAARIAQLEAALSRCDQSQRVLDTLRDYQNDTFRAQSAGAKVGNVLGAMMGMGDATDALEDAAIQEARTRDMAQESARELGMLAKNSWLVPDEIAAFQIAQKSLAIEGQSWDLVSVASEQARSALDAVVSRLGFELTFEAQTKTELEAELERHLAEFEFSGN